MERRQCGRILVWRRRVCWQLLHPSGKSLLITRGVHRLKRKLVPEQSSHCCRRIHASLDSESRYSHFLHFFHFRSCSILKLCGSGRLRFRAGSLYVDWLVINEVDKNVLILGKTQILEEILKLKDPKIVRFKDCRFVLSPERAQNESENAPCCCFQAC
jgi:hypothetical protein